MLAIVLLLATGYLLVVYLLLTLAKRFNKPMSTASRDFHQTSQ